MFNKKNFLAYILFSVFLFSPISLTYAAADCAAQGQAAAEACVEAAGSDAPEIVAECQAQGAAEAQACTENAQAAAGQADREAQAAAEARARAAAAAARQAELQEQAAAEARAEAQNSCAAQGQAAAEACVEAAEVSSPEQDAICQGQGRAEEQACIEAAGNQGAARAAAPAAADPGPGGGTGAAPAATSTGPALDARGVPAGYYNEKAKGVPGLLPSCAFNSSGCDGDNADINIFVELGINIARFIFSIIGTVAFVMFVYGGFTMILSFGSAEKFKKGRDILVAAVVGMIIAFGAYLIVNFVLDVFQVGKDFRVIGG